METHAPIEARIVDYMRSLTGRSATAIEIARHIGLTKKRDVNPTLYRLVAMRRLEVMRGPLPPPEFRLVVDDNQRKSTC